MIVSPNTCAQYPLSFYRRRIHGDIHHCVMILLDIRVRGSRATGPRFSRDKHYVIFDAPDGFPCLLHGTDVIISVPSFSYASTTPDSHGRLTGYYSSYSLRHLLSILSHSPRPLGAFAAYSLVTLVSEPEQSIYVIRLRWLVTRLARRPMRSRSQRSIFHCIPWRMAHRCRLSNG